MKYNDKISVIIPCYNVEKYVEKSIASIMNQTYENIEVIVIDDKSTDNTYDILKQLEKKYLGKMILLQNEENRGLAYTRNFGVLKATGDYIGFIDSDDYVDKNYYDILVNKLVSEDADLVVNDIQLVDENSNNIAPVTKACIGKVTKLNLIDNGLCASACNKLIRKDLLLTFPFLVGKINEDVASIIPIIVKSEKITYAEEAVYYYVQRKNSIQNAKFSEKRFDMFDSISVCLDRIKDSDRYEEYKDIILLHQLLEIYIYILIEIESEKDRKRLIGKFIEKLNEYDFKIWDLKCKNQFIKRHRKNIRVYYRRLINLLKGNNVEKINDTIKFRKEFKSNMKKLIGRNKETGKYTIDELVKLAKKQNNLKGGNVKISAVVPNYNYEEFLIRRIYSILNQNYKIYELVILDDCSKDDSRALIDEIYSKIKAYINIRLVYNEKNSGSAFKQWAKGIEEAKGEYVWIAEADDYCDKRMISELVKPIELTEKIYISYVDTAFTDKKGNIFLKTIKPEIDIMKTGHWDSNFINDGLKEIEDYTFLNNTIANVSSCLIKKDDYSAIYEEIGKYRQSGDWVFYVNVMARGKVAYIDKAMNFYRVHDTQITSNMKKERHLEEIKTIYEMISEKFGTNEFQKKKRDERIKFLIKAWQIEGEK